MYNDVCAIWDSTAIPNMLKSREGMRKITTLLNKCKTLTKVPLSRRQPGFDNDLQQLFDVSICHHTEDSKCTCEQEHKVGGNSYFLMRSSALYEPDSIYPILHRYLPPGVCFLLTREGPGYYRVC